MPHSLQAQGRDRKGAVQISGGSPGKIYRAGPGRLFGQDSGILADVGLEDVIPALSEPNGLVEAQETEQLGAESQAAGVVGGEMLFSAVHPGRVFGQVDKVSPVGVKSVIDAIVPFSLCF